MQQKQNLKHKNHRRVLHFIAETGVLMQMPRSHRQQLGNTFDTVASHSHHTAIIGYCLARMEKLSHEEGLKVMAMGTFHDTPESRIGDLNFIEKHYTTADEQKAITHQLKNLPFAADLISLFEEYIQRKTIAARCAKDADVLEQMYQEWILTHTGNKMAERWFIGDYKDRVPYLYTKSAKKIAQEMKKSHPHKWWFEEFVEKGVNREYLNGS